MSTPGPAIAIYDSLENTPPTARRSAPQVGDILASERSARADIYTVSIVPTRHSRDAETVFSSD